MRSVDLSRSDHLSTADVELGLDQATHHPRAEQEEQQRPQEAPTPTVQGQGDRDRERRQRGGNMIRERVREVVD